MDRSELNRCVRRGVEQEPERRGIQGPDKKQPIPSTVKRQESSTHIMSSGGNVLWTAGEERSGPLQRRAEQLTKAGFTNLGSWMSSVVAETANAARKKQDAVSDWVTSSHAH
jgi:hypothetical protein